MEELFFLQDNEDYEKLCGEIFFTTAGRIVFHCTLCDAKYNGFEAYTTHLYDYHLAASEHLEGHFDLDDRNMSCTHESLNLEEQFDDKNHFVKIEIEPLNDESALKEEEFLIQTLKQKYQNSISVLTEDDVQRTSQRKKPIKRNGIQASTVKNETSRDEDEFMIPAEIREVKKRTLRGPHVTPAEQRKHKCPICGLAFKERHNMRHHFKRHSNEKNHQCPQCDKKFHTPTEVRIHLQFHTRERPFLCSECGRAFLTKSHYVSHVKRHRNQRDFQCSICEKAFYNSGQLKNHMQGHSSERPFVCECSAAFSRKEALKNHIKLHENKREYKCELCEAQFNQKAGLFSHMKTAHKKN